MPGKVVGIFICPVAGQSMQATQTVEAITGLGLKGDRYATGEGTWNAGRIGHRQVTLINDAAIVGSGYLQIETRRNIVTADVELNRFLGERFQIGGVILRGVKYCYPCHRPKELGGLRLREAPDFPIAFHDRAGIVAEILVSGPLTLGDEVMRLKD